MYSYLVNNIGERRSPIAPIYTVRKWAEVAGKYFDSEELKIYEMTEAEWCNNDYPGNWVDDEGKYQS